MMREVYFLSAHGRAPDARRVSGEGAGLAPLRAFRHDYRAGKPLPLGDATPTRGALPHSFTAGGFPAAPPPAREAAS